jgi:hypothetical protein
MTTFDFDTWLTLAKTAPLEFVSQRHKLLDELIEKSPNARRLRGLQFRIDMERRLAHASLGACMRLYGLMWDAFGKLNTELNALSQLACPHPEGQKCHNVIPFPLPVNKTTASPTVQGGDED